MNAAGFIVMLSPFIAALFIFIIALVMPGWVGLAAYALVMPFVIAAIGYFALVSTAQLPYFIFIVIGGIAAAASGYVTGLVGRAIMLALPALGAVGKTAVALVALFASFPLFKLLTLLALMLLVARLGGSQAPTA